MIQVYFCCQGPKWPIAEMTWSSLSTVWVMVICFELEKGNLENDAYVLSVLGVKLAERGDIGLY